MKFIAFDLEGPLAPQDNAFELMSLFPNGGRVFAVISRYDDLLALEGRENYEPGDTLALIVPFLIYRGITEGDIREFAEDAGLVEGARELVKGLKSRGWGVFCISTSYEQYALSIAKRIGIASDNVACTQFPLDRIRYGFRKEDFLAIGQMESDILTMRPIEDDRRIEEDLDRFYSSYLSYTELGTAIAKLKPIGGRRKVEALKGFAGARGVSLDEVVVVGDSITDARMLEEVSGAGGLAIAFNANEYALPHSTMGLASTRLSDLDPVLRAWEKGGLRGVERWVRRREEAGGKGDRRHFQWLLGREDFDEPLQIHKRIRGLVREEAAKLG